MLLCLPRKYRSEDDDYAPRDYSYVGSVAEGARRQQAEPIHNDPERASVRHRVDPNAPAEADKTAVQPPTEGEARGYEAARRIPRAGDAPMRAASIAYPRPRDNDFAKTPTYAPQSALPLQAAEAQAQRGIGSRVPGSAKEGAYVGRRQAKPSDPNNTIPGDDLQQALRSPQRGVGAQYGEYVEAPDRSVQGYAPQATPSQTFAPQTKSTYVAPVQPGDVFDPDGSQYAKPAAQEIPDWLRAAQQNNVPFFEERRRRTPKVEAAPQLPPEPAPTDLLGRPIARRTPPQPQNQLPVSAEEYEAAGYPPELIFQQRYAEQAIASDASNNRKRHGAQLAAPPPIAAQSHVHRRADGQSVPLSALPTREEYARRQASSGGTAPEYQRGYAPRADFAPGSGLTDSYGTPDANGYNAYYALNGRPNRQAPKEGWEEEPEEGQGDEKPKLKIPVLGIATFAVAMLVVLLWILQMSFVNQKEDVLVARAAVEQKLENNHPYRYRDLIEREATANNLHPAFVAAIVLNESSFNPKAESDVGARGLMQMMPDTAKWVHDKMGLTDEYNFDQMYDADTNVHYACWYLAFLCERFHNDPILVSAAFHAGQNTVQNWLNDSRYSTDSQSISLDKMTEGPTKNYATRVLKAFATYRRLYYEGGIAGSTASAGSSPIAETTTPMETNPVAASAPDATATDGGSVITLQ